LFEHEKELIKIESTIKTENNLMFIGVVFYLKVRFQR
jgi:hypothetical protein